MPEGWDEGGAWPGLYVVGMVAAGQGRWSCSFGMKWEQRIWGKSGQFEATMRVGVLPTASSHHRDSFSTAARNPFLLASLAADTSSPLPGSFAPQNLFKEPAIPLQTRSSLFPTITTLLSPATSSYTIPSFSLKTPHGNQASPCRLHSLPNDASTNPQAQSLPCSPLSSLRSN